MDSHAIIITGGICFIVGALAFVAVFSYLAAKFNYPKVLDGEAEHVLPRLRGGGTTMRAAWAVYALLPLLLVPGAVGALVALTHYAGWMLLALMLASLGALAMCLGLMRWPSIHWELAGAYEKANADARVSIGATFKGLNLYLGNYIGEFLGEICLGGFFAIAGIAMLNTSAWPAWLGIGGTAFGVLFIVGAFRNVTAKVQWLADINNLLLPLWMIIFGGSLIWRG